MSISPFIVDKEGPPGIFAVFEDDGETGYLYVYEPNGPGVVRHVHVYNRSPLLTVSESDVAIAWSENNRKCGVIIRDSMRAIIDLHSGREGRVWMESDESSGIDDVSWLKGF